MENILNVFGRTVRDAHSYAKDIAASFLGLPVTRPRGGMRDLAPVSLQQLTRPNTGASAKSQSDPMGCSKKTPHTISPTDPLETKQLFRIRVPVLEGSPKHGP